MTALTITLLPEPVAPAMSRCGILARSTAWALPATSRPRANVSVEPDALKSTSSRIRRRATTLKSLFGISMPTALLPGIGASIRSDRAASAIARSSDRRLDPADLDVRRRLDLVLGDDRARVAPHDLGRDPEARQLLDDDLLVPARGPPRRHRRGAGWRCPRASVSGGRMYSMRSLVGGESPASVTSSRSRGGPGRNERRGGRGATGRRERR